MPASHAETMAPIPQSFNSISADFFMLFAFGYLGLFAPSLDDLVDATGACTTFTWAIMPAGYLA
jgi:hypothetical protein